MATWQFDIHALPSIAVERLCVGTPMSISPGDFNNSEWWAGIQIPTNFRDDFGKLLPRMSSWSLQLEQWGYEDGNRIDVVWEGAEIVEVFVRLDVRALSSVFLVGTLELARKNRWAFRASNGIVFRPSMARLLAEIHKSDAFRFIEDPCAFLSELEQARRIEVPKDTT